METESDILMLTFVRRYMVTNKQQTSFSHAVTYNVTVYVAQPVNCPASCASVSLQIAPAAFTGVLSRTADLSSFAGSYPIFVPFATAASYLITEIDGALTVKPGAPGNAGVVIMVKDNGGNNSYVKAFTITANPLRVVMLSANFGTGLIKKGAINILSAQKK